LPRCYGCAISWRVAPPTVRIDRTVRGDPEAAKNIIALTYGMIAMVDDAVGEFLAAFKRLALKDNTIIIFTADHGIMLNYLLHYQGLIRVPCIVADPAASKAGTVQSNLAGTIDLAPTTLGRAGIQPFNGVQGRDLLDTNVGAPDSQQIEEDSVFRLFGTDVADRVRTLVTDRWRLTPMTSRVCGTSPTAPPLPMSWSGVCCHVW